MPSNFLQQTIQDNLINPNQAPVIPPVKPQPVAQPAPVQAPVQSPAPIQSPQNVPQGLDPQIVNLARAIRQAESGGDFQKPGKSGEYGGYQFMPDTWAGASKRYLGASIPLTQATPEQQNEVAYKQLVDWKAQHPDWNIANFASAWNAGEGKPDAYLNNVGVNSKGVQYDTPAYAHKVALAYQQFKAQNPTSPLPQTDPTQNPTPEEAPSVGGFAQNVVKSGAGLLANVGNALLHPIDTVQNIGGAAVGGLEKVAGETTDNTAKFDNVVEFFKQRYGSLDQFEKTLYHDPVGVAADLSTVLGGAGLALKGAGIASKISELGDAGNVLSKASDLTNPLAPIATGLGKVIDPAKENAIRLVGGAAKLEDNTINIARTGTLTPEVVANTTREAVGTEVAQALKQRIGALDESSKEYSAIREIQRDGGSFSSDSLIPVSHNFFEEQLRKEAGLDVRDGKIISSAGSDIRGGEVGKLQDLFNLYKPTFQKGAMTANEFLNFREDLAKIAYNDLGKKNTDVARVTDNIRRNLNDAYRGDIPGLKELDLKFSKETTALKELQKGIFDRNGKLTDGAYNLVANATNKGNTEKLARLEKIVPGITEKIKVLKAVEDMQKALTKTGTYTASILESGTVLAGVSTGHLGVAATGFAAMIISRPENAVKVITALDKVDKRLALAVMARVAKYATITGDLSGATTGTSPTESQQQSPQEQPALPPPTSGEASSQPEGVQQSSQAQVSSQSLEDLAKSNNFDLQTARKDGYTDAEIQSYLQSN